MREECSYTREEFLERKEAVENAIVAVKVSMDECRIEQFDIEGAYAYAANFIRTLDRQWFDLSPRLRPRFQQLVFPEGIPFQKGKGFGTAKLAGFLELNRGFDDDESPLVDLVRSSWNQIIAELKKWEELGNAVLREEDLEPLRLAA
jgi:hypothetical protein